MSERMITEVKESQMKIRNKVMIVVSTLVVVATIFMVVNQKNMTTGVGHSTKSNLNHQESAVEEKLKIDETDGNIEGSSIITNENETNQENNETSSTVADTGGNGQVSMSGAAAQKEVQTQVEVQTQAENADLSNSGGTGTNTSGLHFSSREEAIAFGMSRLSAEEIALYNKAAARGLTPEQEQLAIQMAYSRFSAEEIAAIEEALSR
jgi:hypothetical protein